jgi:hypothetical protein
MIWVVWGHDLYRKPACGVIPKARRFAGNLWRWDYLKNHKIRQFKAIGIGFKFDAIEVKRRFGSNMKILTTPYGLMPDMHNFKSVIDGTAKENASAKHGNKPYKVMIGHSAFPYLNHEKTVNQLKKFKDENILVSFPFPYGSPEYAGKIANFAIEIFGTKKVEIINERLPIEDYIKYLTSVDACVLEQYQGGLGNFYILLYLEKKLFMNDAGILKMAADLEGIESYSTDNIDRMSFTEFSSPLSNGKRGKEFSELYIDGENFIRMWKNTLKTLR